MNIYNLYVTNILESRIERRNKSALGFVIGVGAQVTRIIRMARTKGQNAQKRIIFNSLNVIFVYKTLRTAVFGETCAYAG